MTPREYEKWLENEIKGTESYIESLQDDLSEEKDKLEVYRKMLEIYDGVKKKL